MKNVILMLLFLTTACMPQPATQSSSSSGSVDFGSGDSGGSGGAGDGSGSSGAGTGTTCHGSESDGQGSGVPIFHFNLLLSGGVSWVPNNYSSSLARESNISLEEGQLFFQSDARLKVRFKALSQPVPPTGEKYCYNRTTGLAADAYEYTKLKFTLYLRDVLCNQVDPADSSQCNEFRLGDRYRMQTIGPVNVGECSQIINLGSIRNHTQWGTVVEIANVYADSVCQSNGTYCPAGKPVRSASCWNMTMQVVTDYTQDFK